MIDGRVARRIGSKLAAPRSPFPAKAGIHAAFTEHESAERLAEPAAVNR